MENNQKDLEFLRDLDEKPLNLYLKGLIPAEKADILRWKTTQKVKPDEQMKFQLAIKNLRKVVPAPAPSHVPLELTPIRTEQFWIDKARQEVDFFVEYVSGKAPARHHKIWLANIFHPDYNLINIIAPPGSAKAQPLDAKIATPTGWRLMGELRVGDQVISVDGCPTEVTGVFPQGLKDVCRVTFTDGSSTECTDDHLWTVRKRSESKWQVFSLRDIRTKAYDNVLKTYVTTDKGRPWINNEGTSRYHIPVTAPVEYGEKDFIISPYIMGALLGDGTFAQNDCRFACKDPEILNRVANELPDRAALKHISRYDYAVKGNEGRGNRSPFLLALRAMGLYRIKSVNKFVPRNYLLGSVTQRIALLQGLMDTDGTITSDKRGSAVFCTISPALRDNLIELVQSLGGIATYASAITTYTHDGEKRYGQMSYKISCRFSNGIVPFYLPRKADRYQTTSRDNSRGIVDIEFVGQKETQCIKVAHESALYLTDHFIVTHNTHYLVYALSYYMGYNPLTTNSLISVSSTQAESRMEMLKNIVTYNKAYQNVFPHICVDDQRPNNTQEFSLRVREDRLPYSEWQTLMQQQGEPHDPTFKAAGYGGKAIIGSRWSGLCGIDDIVDESMLSAEIQKKVGTYILQTLHSRLVPRKGRMVVIGTRWMLGDVAQQLKENASFRTLEFPAERIVNGERKSYWPEYWPLETLDEVAKTLSATSLYETNYMCNPAAASMQKFTQEMLSYDLPIPLPTFTHVFISTDFALSVQQKADYTVYQAIGIDTEGSYYILDQRRYKEGPDDTPALLGLFADEVASRYGRLDDIIIESVAFSGTMGNLLRQKRSDLPFTKFVPKGDKAHRASLVADIARNHKLFINQSMQDIEQLKLEWLNFGSAPHDDTLDPMGLLLQFRGASTVTASYKLVKSPFML